MTLWLNYELGCEKIVIFSVGEKAKLLSEQLNTCIKIELQC